MQRMINILHERYTQEQLDGMPQYQRLMTLYRDDRTDVYRGTDRLVGDTLGRVGPLSFLISHVRKC